MSEINEYKNCVGCYTDTHHETRQGTITVCNIKMLNREGKCPCTRCIIKMVCHDSCDDFDNFRTEV